jgi:micrococcal nuclease
VAPRLITALLGATALAILCGGCRSAAVPGPGDPAGGYALVPNAVVDEVVDGDTLVVRISGRAQSARLIGIDTPETVDPRRPVQCYGPEASARAAELVPPGTWLHLELDAEARDAYDRLLVYAYRASDGLFVNLDLAASGHADVLSIEPNTVHARPIGAAVAEARAQGRGLWATCGGPDVPLEAPR